LKRRLLIALATLASMSITSVSYAAPESDCSLEELSKQLSKEGALACEKRLGPSECTSLERCIRTMGAVAIYREDERGSASGLIRYARRSKLQCACVRSHLGRQEFQELLTAGSVERGASVWNCSGR
jgi:hypothetical protein